MSDAVNTAAVELDLLMGSTASRYPNVVRSDHPSSLTAPLLPTAPLPTNRRQYHSHGCRGCGGDAGPEQSP